MPFDSPNNVFSEMNGILKRKFKISLQQINFIAHFNQAFVSTENEINRNDVINIDRMSAI